MNQRAAVPPFGPGPAATGSGVTRTTLAAGTGVTAAADALAAAGWLAATVLGAVVAVLAPHADARSVTTPARAIKARGPERVRFIVSAPPFEILRSPTSVMRPGLVGVGPLVHPPVAGRLRACASRRSRRVR